MACFRGAVIAGQLRSYLRERARDGNAPQSAAIINQIVDFERNSLTTITIVRRLVTTNFVPVSESTLGRLFSGV